MGSRWLNNNTKSVELEVIDLFALLTIGSSGAVTLTRGKGITSATHTATGRYTLVFDDTWKRLLYADAQVLRATGTCDLQVKLNAETVATAATKTLELGTTKTSDGTVVDPTSGDLIYVYIKLGNTAD